MAYDVTQVAAEQAKPADTVERALPGHWCRPPLRSRRGRRAVAWGLLLLVSLPAQEGWDLQFFHTT
jgi:hypothetical protein